MSAFNNISSIYKIAMLLGARIEVQGRDGKWSNLNNFLCLAHDTKYRIVSEDTNIIESINALIPQFFDVIKFREYDYYVSKNAKKEGTIILFQYGFGEYVQVQADGTLKEISFEDSKKILEENGAQYIYSQSVQVFENSVKPDE